MIKSKYHSYLDSDRPIYRRPPMEYEEPPIDYTDESDVEQYETIPVGQRKTDEDGHQYHHRHCERDDEDLPITRSMQTKLAKRIPWINFKQIQLGCLIGQGGFGKVYQGVFRNKHVAVKEPIYYYQSNVEDINNEIVEEALLHYQLKHPNIIQMYGLSLREEKIYMILEYARGNSLYELLTKKTLSPNIIIKFSIQISSAMEYLHGFQPCAIIHRDLKSPNSESMCCLFGFAIV